MIDPSAPPFLLLARSGLICSHTLEGALDGAGMWTSCPRSLAPPNGATGCRDEIGSPSCRKDPRTDPESP